jgi:hypothetical protein
MQIPTRDIKNAALFIIQRQDTSPVNSSLQTDALFSSAQLY